MNYRTSVGSAAFASILCGLVMGTGGCRKPKVEEKSANARPTVVAPELESNGLAALPGAIYRSEAGSTIHWQPWTKESMERAKAANRLVFAVVALPQQPGFQGVLDALEKNPAVVAAINATYVPVLIDGDASREMGLLTAELCAELEIPLQLPLFVWMTYEGNAVASIPASKAANAVDLFNQSDAMIGQTWLEDARNNTRYVLNNSAAYNGDRRVRIASRKNRKVMSEKPAEDAVHALRQLTSFYDSFSRTFDEAGGLFPAGSLDLLATAAIQPGLPADIRGRCLETTRELMSDLLPSAMFDPLEGGVFSARRGNSWALPAFHRDCVTQARAAVALFNAYLATGDSRILDKALGLLAFAEKTFTTSEGLFSVGLAEQTDPAAWLWSVEEIEKELPAEDAAWWIKATGMKGLGNLPSEVDPRREYFRSNSLGIGKSVAQLAADGGQPVEAFRQRFESTRKQLLKVRNTRLGQRSRDDCSHAGATFRMVSAYAAAFSVTGDQKYRTQAVALLDKARTAFADGPRLRVFSKDAPKPVGEARAFIYGLALQAALDVSAITSDEKWLVWSEDLATTAAELFTSADFLKECPDDANIVNLPFTDLAMVFDDSTAGLISFAECRLADRERPLVPTFSKLATPLPTYAVERPVLHTDLLQATIAREFQVSIVVGTGVPTELKLAIERLPVRMVQRRPAKSKDEIPAGSAKVVFPNGDSRLVSSAGDLRDAILPMPDKS